MPLSILPTVRKLEQRFEQLDKALRNSFDNLKRDLSHQSETLEYLKAKIREQEQFNLQLLRDMAELQQAHITSLKQSLKQEILEELTTKPKKKVSTTENQAISQGLKSGQSSGSEGVVGLTALHIKILKRLMILQMEGRKRYLSMRVLASDLYPDKGYVSIKTTLSKYIKRLSQKGLVDKRSQGRLYLSYTEKALQFADSERLNRMKELISQNKG
jgi:hypothetical protein